MRTCRTGAPSSSARSPIAATSPDEIAGSTTSDSPPATTSSEVVLQSDASKRSQIGLDTAQIQHSTGARFQSRLDRPVDEAGPAVRDVGAGEEHPPLGTTHLRVVACVPAGRVDRPGSACVLVGEPVVQRGIDELVPG